MHFLLDCCCIKETVLAKTPCPEGMGTNRAGAGWDTGAEPLKGVGLLNPKAHLHWELFKEDVTPVHGPSVTGGVGVQWEKGL